MEITINYYAIIVSAIASMIVGAIWYGPLFGKKWMEVVGMNKCTEEEKKVMKKESISLYIIQFLITLFQVWVLASFVGGWGDFDTPKNILWIWAGFIVPAIAGTVMWTNTPNKMKWAQFLIQGGYQLVMFVIFGFILAYWK